MSEAACGAKLANELLHSGYNQGPTKGFVRTLACYLLTQLSKVPWAAPHITTAFETCTPVDMLSGEWLERCILDWLRASLVVMST